MRIFLDIGAFNGALSLRAAESGLYDVVHAFEPNPAFGHPGNYFVYWHRDVAWDSDCLLPFYCGSNNGEPTQGSSAFGDKSMGDKKTRREIQARSLSRFIESLPPGDIDCHIDAEGSEYRLLTHLVGAGAMDRITRLSVEWHADKIPSISAATDKAVRAMVAALDKPECLVREE